MQEQPESHTPPTSVPDPLAPLDAPPGWSLVERGYRPEEARAFEGLFTIGSGRLHQRASYEEGLKAAPQDTEYLRLPTNVTAEKFRPTPQKWGTYVPGIYGPHPTLNNELINLPSTFDLIPTVAGHRLDLDDVDAVEQTRVLRLDQAVLRRDVSWRVGAISVHARFERFISAARPTLCVQRLTLLADADVPATVAGGVDAAVRTNGYDHLRDVSLTESGDADVVCSLQTDGGDTVELRTRLRSPDAAAPAAYEASSRRGRRQLAVQLRAGEPVVVEKRSAIMTSRDLDPHPTEVVLNAADAWSFDALLEEHAATWATRWAACDVEIEGDAASQLAMRASIYHLLRCHTANDPRVSIDAKGYAGEAYFGRFFWDTDVYLLPFYLYTQPDAARSLVEFRIRTLDGARENARARGYRGARFAWESDHLGRECCATWPYVDHEVHVTADVVYALAHDAAATGDASLMQGAGAELIVEAARYWLDRSDVRAGETRRSILGVMGPDEYSPIHANNAFTNFMARFVLQLAAQDATGAATAEEKAAFADAADAIQIPEDPARDLILQSEDFELLAEPRYDELWTDRSQPFAANVPQERLYRTKCLKQPDVLMLMHLWPRVFSPQRLRAAWDYYVPLTCHDSSLSYGVHAILARRLGLRDEAWRFFQLSSGLDLDTAGGKPAEGIHIAAAANNWAGAVLGFAGLLPAMTADRLTLEPDLPDAWTRLAFPIVWRGQSVHVEIDPRECRLSNRSEQPLEAEVLGHAFTVAPGETARTPITGRTD